VCVCSNRNWLRMCLLKKAYDSVSKEAMWLALDRLGVPLKLIKLFHDIQSLLLG